jgi:hypothetical protein
LNQNGGRLEECKFPNEWKEVVLLEYCVVGECPYAELSAAILAAQNSINLQAFLPDIIPPGTIGFLMDNFVFGFEKEEYVEPGKSGCGGGPE